MQSFVLFFFSLCCSSLGQRSSFFRLHYLRGLSVINEESPCTWPTRSTFKMKSRSRVRMFIVALQTGNVLLPLIQKNKQNKQTKNAFIKLLQYLINCTMARAPPALGAWLNLHSLSLIREDIWSALVCIKRSSLISQQQNWPNIENSYCSSSLSQH